MLAPSSTDLAPGVAFGGYVVRELIGRGGMATVYRAEHMLLNKPVALKVMDRALLARPGAGQRFLLEGRTAAAIKHPNVVDITDVGVQDGVPYLVMELLSGEDLAGHLSKRGPLEDAATVRLALPIIAALHAAHASGVVHRDIKPSNIFMARGPDGQFIPKVLDFGISKLTFDAATFELVTTPEHQLIGTPRYLPPEALQGARELGPLSDQYSLGVVLYECATGSTPFSGDTLLALLTSLSRGSFPSPRALAPNVSPELDRVITRAMSLEPRDRFPSIRDMGRALLELAAERTQVVWAQSFRSPLDEPATGRRGELGSLGPAETLPSTERLPTGESRPPAHRSRLAASLVLSGTLVLAGLWIFRDAGEKGAQPVGPAVVRHTAVRQTSMDARPPASAASASGASQTVLGLQPPPAAVVSRAAAPAANVPRARAKVRRSAGSRRASARVARLPEQERSSPKRESLPDAPARASTPSEPPSRARRLGANGSPLLD